MAESHLKGLSRDLLVDVMARLDGLSLAAAACTCTELQDVARERGLWESLCHATWPSTACSEAKDVVPDDKFYAESRPMILYDDRAAGNRGGHGMNSEVFSKDLVCLVDVFYKGECVLSKVIDGVPEAEEGNFIGQGQKWFADRPYELDVVRFDYSQEIGGEDDVDAEDDEAGDLSQELENDIRLSWLILNKKSKKSVSVSSWTPLMVQRSWISSNNYTLQFKCIVPVECSILPHGVAECVITASCELTKDHSSLGGGGLKWEEISMSIKDMAGAHLGGKKSLMVLNQALYCARSNNVEEVQKGYAQFEKMKMEMKRARDYKETLANALCVSLEIIVFAALYYTLFL